MEEYGGRKTEKKIILTTMHEKRGLAEVEWEIQDFLNLPYENEEYMRSPHFLLGDGFMYLGVYPHGHSPETSGWISLNLYRNGGLHEHPVSFSCGIKAGGEMIKFMEYECILKSKDSWSETRFIKRSSLHRVLKDSDGALTVVCAIRLLDGHHKEATTQTSRPEGSKVLLKKFEDMFRGGNWSDIKIKVGEQMFDAHKLVLRARSPVFAAMLDHEMTESQTGVIEVADMDPDFFQDFLLFIYTGNFSHVTASNAVSLYRAADKYAIEELKEECRCRMVADLSVDSVLDVILLAATYDEDELSRTATEFFIENAEETMCTDKWELFLEQHVPTVNELLLKTTKTLKAQCKKN